MSCDRPRRRRRWMVIVAAVALAACGQSAPRPSVVQRLAACVRSDEDPARILDDAALRELASHHGWGATELELLASQIAERRRWARVLEKIEENSGHIPPECPQQRAYGDVNRRLIAVERRLSTDRPQAAAAWLRGEWIPMEDLRAIAPE